MAAMAADELEAVRAQIAALEVRETELVGLVRKEAVAAAERASVAAWEAETTFATDAGHPFQAIRTWPVNHAGVKRWWVAAGVKGNLLAVWEVNEYRGERRTRLLYGSAPWNVWHSVARAWELVAI